MIETIEGRLEGVLVFGKVAVHPAARDCNGRSVREMLEAAGAPAPLVVAP